MATSQRMAVVHEETITAAGALDNRAGTSTVSNAATAAFAVTLAAPEATAFGGIKIIEDNSGTATVGFTLALTNVIGGTATTTATFNADKETLVLVAGTDKWIVLKQQGVTLS